MFRMNNTAIGTSQKPSNCTKGEPIDLQTGIMFRQWNDLAMGDIMPLTLTRTYSSASTASQMFGIGGNSNFGMHLGGSNGSAVFSTVQMVLPCGEGVSFNLVSGPPPAGRSRPAPCGSTPAATRRTTERRCNSCTTTRRPARTGSLR